MLIQIICVGKIKETYMQHAIDDYKKRLSHYCKFEIIEVPDLKISDRASLADEKSLIAEEGRLILTKIKSAAYIIALCIEGEELSSIQLSQKLQTLMVSGKSHIAFVIGGSLGIWDQIKIKANYKFSMSRLTLTHQMARLFLEEQIYRAFKIIGNETYHK